MGPNHLTFDGCAADCALPPTPRWSIDEGTLCGGPRESAYPGAVGKPAGYKCEAGSYCVESGSPNFGFTNFDNILYAWLTIFQCISLEGWTDVMYWVQDAVSPYTWIYFCTMIVLGSFFAINLALAVLYVSFVGERVEDDGEDDGKGEVEGEGELESEEAYQASKLAEMNKMFADAEPTTPSAAAAPSAPNGSSGTGSSPVFPVDALAAAAEGGGVGRSNKPWIAEGYATVHEWVKAKGADIEDIAMIDGVPTVLVPSNGKKMQRLCRQLAVSSRFSNLTMFLIIFNTVLMSSEFYGMPIGMVQAYEIINYVVTVYFALEMVVKIVGLKPRGYVADSFNIFDGVVVIISLIELAAADSGGSLSVLRSCRLLRILKLARSWPQLRKIIATIMQTIPSMSSLAGMLFLFIFIFDLLGMQMFGYEFIFCDSYEVEGAEPVCPPGILSTDCPKRRDCYAPCVAAQADSWITFASGASGPCTMFRNDDGPTYLARLGRSDQARHNFDDIFWAFVTIFQVLTGENWNTVMYDGMRTQGVGACIYFLLLVIIGNYIVLNLFLAILLDNFSDMEDDPEEVAAAEEAARKEKEDEAKKAEEEAAEKKQRQAEADAPKKYDALGRPVGGPVVSPVKRARKALQAFIAHKAFDNTVIVLILVSSALLAVDSPKLDPDSVLKEVLTILDTTFVVIFTLEAVIKLLALGVSYFSNSWNLLDFVIVIIGLVSSILGLIVGPGGLGALRALRAFRALRPLRVAARNEGMKVVVSALFQAVPAIGNVALVCILFYLIFGILGLNLFMGKMHRCQEFGGDVISPLHLGVDEKLMTRAWCTADTHLVGCVGASPASFYSAGGEAGWSCVENAGTSSGVNEEYNRMETWGGSWTCTASSATLAVVNASTQALNEAMVEGYGVLGSAFYEEPAAATAMSTGVFVSSCEPSFLVTEWKAPATYDFDNIGNSVLILFETATLEMWLDVMYHSVDAVEEGFHPRLNHNPAACVFYIIFIIMGAFFVMNLFVGVTIDKFNEMKEAAAAEKGEGASVFVTEDQRRWQQVEKMLSKTKPVKHYDVPTNPFRLAVFKLCTTNEFDATVMVLILANVLVMSMSYAGESEAWANNLFWTNTVFTFVFTLEVILKNIALGPTAYLQDAWNRFDVAVVALSIVGFVITVATTTKASYLALLRIFRIARAFRLIKRAKGLRTLLNTLIFSLPALTNVGSVLFLFFFIFAVMGMNLFGRIKTADFVNRQANFEDFPAAILVLFRMATGESWNGIMHDCMIEKECVEMLTGDAAGEWLDSGSSALKGLIEDTDFINRCTPSKGGTVIFFCIFVLLCAFVMLNLVIAVILDNFESYNKAEDLPVSESDFGDYAYEWGKLDRYSSYYIKITQFPTLLKRLNAPLGFKSIPSDLQKVALSNFLFTCEIKNKGEKIHFVDTLQALAARVEGVEKPPQAEAVDDASLKAGEDPEEEEVNPDNHLQVCHYFAATYVQTIWKGKLARRQMAKKRSQSVAGKGKPAERGDSGGEANKF